MKSSSTLMIFLNKIIKKGNKSKIILAAAAAAAAAAAVGIKMLYFCHQIRVGSSKFERDNHFSNTITTRSFLLDSVLMVVDRGVLV